METFECMQNRRSIRKYLPKDVEKEKIGAMIEFASLAPSAGNLNNWAFVIVRDPEKRKDIAECALQQYWIREAPVIIVICGDSNRAEKFYGVRGKRLYLMQDCAAAAQNMLLAATNMGLGACWVGAFEEEMLRKILTIPDNMRPQAIVTVGYAGEMPLRPPKPKIEELTYFDKYGIRWPNVEVYIRDYGAVTKRTVEQGQEKVKGLGRKGVEFVKKGVDKIIKNYSED